VGDDGTWFFLARRSLHCHRGGTWAIPGGALDLGEEPIDGALREFGEEIGSQLDRFELGETHQDDHGGWSYWTVIIDVPQRFEPPATLGWETAEARWVAEHELGELELFDAFSSTLTRLGLL
jgi:ADP-ribose pyrophosphatase YjhB (NUDIX family)